MIYFIQGITGGPIKIGYAARDVRKRIADLQAGNPEELVILACIEGDLVLEHALHRKFKKDKYRSEWFNPTPELLDFIANIESFNPQELLQPVANPWGWTDERVLPERYQRIQIQAGGYSKRSALRKLNSQRTGNPTKVTKPSQKRTKRTRISVLSSLHSKGNWITASQVGRYLQMTTSHVIRFIKRNELSGIKLDEWWIKRADLDEFIEERSNIPQ